MKKQDMKIEKLYDLTHTMAGEYLSGFEYPWEALEGISAFLTELGNTLPEEEFEKRERISGFIRKPRWLPLPF